MSIDTASAMNALRSYRAGVLDADLDDLETAIYDLVTDLHHLADVYGCDWVKITDLAEMNYEEEAAPADGDAFADLPPVLDEVMIAEAMGITVMDVRIADHVEMVHERELAPGTTGLNDIHASMHDHISETHTHVWKTLP